jgi:hypothetical protein
MLLRSQQAVMPGLLNIRQILAIDKQSKMANGDFLGTIVFAQQGFLKWSLEGKINIAHLVAERKVWTKQLRLQKADLNFSEFGSYSLRRKMS